MKAVFVRYFVLIWAIWLIPSGGCQESQQTSGVAMPTVGRETEGIVRYLLQERTDGLESIADWDNEYGPGLCLTTKHYEIYTTLLDPLMLRQTPAFMEAAYQGYVAQLSKPVELTIPLTVYLFADRPQWEAFTRQFAGAQAEMYCKIRAGAYCHNGACVVYNIGRKRTFAALGHEGWHQFNMRIFRYRLPSWLDEGVAMLFEVSEQSNGTFTFDPARNNYRLDGLRTTLRQRRAMALGELLKSNPGEVLASNNADALLTFYSQAYALVRFLREADQGRRLERFQRLLGDGLTGQWPLGEYAGRMAADRNLPRIVEWNRVVGTQLFRYYIDDDIERIEKEYLAFCARITN